MTCVPSFPLSLQSVSLHPPSVILEAGTGTVYLNHYCKWEALGGPA